VVKIWYCIEHGPFAGRRWNGHRRHCHAKRASKEEYTKHSKKGGANVLPLPKTPAIVSGVGDVEMAFELLKEAIKKIDDSIVTHTLAIALLNEKKRRLLSSIKEAVK
jgi:hypothetical protein